MKKYSVYLSLVIIGIAILFFYQFYRYNDGKLHVIFCNVGQGDGIIMKTPQGKVIVLDGGPDNSIETCYSKHMPFWQHTISLAMLSHPHADHLAGFLPLFSTHTVLSFVTELLKNNTIEFNDLMTAVTSQGIKPEYVLSGDSVALDGIKLTIVGPTQEFLSQTSPNGLIGESKEFASVETLLQYGNFSVLFTGDSQATELEQAISSGLLTQVTVLQVPHHGSATELSEDVLKQLNPQLGVISVGKKNLYGHPSPLTLLLLQSSKVTVKRTDQNGDIELISDGKAWQVN